jgi:hypothetical protein
MWLLFNQQQKTLLIPRLGFIWLFILLIYGLVHVYEESYKFMLIIIYGFLFLVYTMFWVIWYQNGVFIYRHILSPLISKCILCIVLWPWVSDNNLGYTEADHLQNSINLFFFFVVLRIEPRILDMLGKHSVLS